MATTIKKLNEPETLCGEKGAALLVLEFLYKNFPAVRDKIFEQFELSVEDKFKHVRRWTMEVMEDLYPLEKSYQKKIVELWKKRLSDERSSVSKAAKGMLEKIGVH